VLVDAYFAAFIVSLGVSLLATRTVWKFAVAREIVFAPQSARHIHKRAIPRLGGVAIFLTVSVCLVAASLLGILPTGDNTSVTGLTKAIGIPATFIFLVGLWDDVRGLSAWVKFGAQILAGGYLYLRGFGIERLSLIPGTHGRVMSFVLTVMWVVLITNAFNLIDGLDGLAAGAALFSTIAIFCCLLVIGSSAGAFFCIVLAGALVGFLRYNFNPAQIFLGDCGSMLLGFCLSAIGLVYSAKAPTVIAIAIPIVSFGLPLLDLGLAVMRRVLNGVSLFSADKNHIHHKLLKRGLSQREAVLVLYGACATFSLTSLFMLYPSGRILALVFTTVGIGLFVGLQQLRYHELSEMARILRGPFDQKQVVSNNLRLRRAIDEFAHAHTLTEFRDVAQLHLSPMGIGGMILALPRQVAQALESESFASHDPVEFIWDRKLRKEHCLSLELPLTSRSGEWWGRLTLLRADAESPLRFDLNLLLQVLPAAMGDALARSIHSEDRRSPALPLKIQLPAHEIPPALSASSLPFTGTR